METRIVRCEENIDEMKVKSKKKLIGKVLSYIVKIDHLSYIMQPEILGKCGVIEGQYNSALSCLEKNSVVYKQKPCEVNIGTCNTVILKLWKANTNIQYVTGEYVMLTYLASYFCQPEHTISEHMKKASKEAYGKYTRRKLHSIDKIFLTKREVSTHEAIKRVLSLPMRYSNIDRCSLCSYKSLKIEVEC